MESQASQPSSKPTSKSRQKSVPRQRQYGLKPFKQAMFFDRGTNDGRVNVSFQHVFPPKPGAVTSSSVKTGSAAAATDTDQVSSPFPSEREITALSEAIENAEKELISTSGCMEKFVSAVSPDFPCAGCMDVFPTQFSLDDHLKRNSYTLVLECPGCTKRTIAFPNKCMMYQHLSTHYDDLATRVKVAEQHSHINSLPKAGSKLAAEVDKVTATLADTSGPATSGPATSGPATSRPAMNGTDTTKTVINGSASNGLNEVHLSSSETLSVEPTIVDIKPELDGEEESGDKLVSPPVTIAKTEISENSSSAMSVDGDSSVYDSGSAVEAALSCTECSATFDNETSLVGHFAAAQQQAGSTPSFCTPCNKKLMSACGAKAHQRIHTMTEPFTCPDCGITMHKKNVFLKHLRLLCLHFSKIYEFPCPTCSESFKSGEEQMSHLVQHPNHLRYPGERSYYKCNGCPKAFKSVAAHSKHKTCPGAGCSVVHMCNNCPEPAVFRSFSELQIHRNSAHTDLKWNPKRALFYSCYMCSYKSKSLPGFTDHLLKIHQKKPVLYMCNFCGIDTESNEALNKHLASCVFKESCGQKPSGIMERLPKLSSGSSVSDQSLNNSMEMTYTQHSGNQTAGSFTSRGQSPAFNCHLCTAKYRTYDKLRDHVNIIHNGRGMIYDCWICKGRGVGQNFYRQKLLEKHLLDVHKVKVPVSTENGSSSPTMNDSSTQEPPAKKLKIWGDDSRYQCCRCDFSTVTYSDFKEHIKEHRMTAESVQCGECGMCFSVQLALRRHLFAVHKVTDYPKYSRNLYMVEYEEQLNNTDGKCPVCAEAIDNEALLRKHIRTHGMVYINTKRAPASTTA